jgi:hypothetical protein
MDSANDILNCVHCNRNYDEPKILPCGNTVCQNCILVHLIENPQFESKTEFKCFMCQEAHSFPQNKCFPINKPLSKLLSKEYKRFNITGESADKLKSCMAKIHTEKSELEHLSKNATDFIIAECQKFKIDIDLAIERSIEQLHKIRDEFLGELNEYQIKTISTHEKNKETCGDEMKLHEMYEELESFEKDLNTFDFLEAIKKAQDLEIKFIAKKVEIQNFIFDKNFISFKESNKKLEYNHVGMFSYSSLNNLDVNLRNCLDFNKMNRVDFNLNSLVENKHPFKSDVEFQVLENGNYVIAYRNISDSFNDLIVVEPNFNILKSINLPVTDFSRIFKFKNRILIRNRIYTREFIQIDTLVAIGEDFALKTISFQQNDKILYVTANERYIFCLLDRSNQICFYNWNLEIINSFTPNNALPQCAFNLPIAAKVNQLEIVDENYFLFKYDNKLRFFNENGKLLNECLVTVDNVVVNQTRKQIVVWNKKINKLIVLGSRGEMLSEINLLNFSNEDLNLNLFIDNMGNYLFVDLEYSVLFKLK